MWLFVGSAGEGIRPATLGPRTVEAMAVADVVIEERAPPKLTGVVPVPGQIALFPGETIRYSAAVYDQEGREVLGAPLSWQVVDSRAGTITAGGVFRAGFTIGAFSNAIVVTADAPAGSKVGFVQAEASILVLEPRDRLVPDSIRALPDPVIVQPGESIQVIALVVDVNGALIGAVDLQWSMTQPQAGTISEEGNFTAANTRGIYPEAIRVRIAPEEGVETPAVHTSLDVRILDDVESMDQITTMMLPQAISLQPGEEIQFNVVALDRRANPLVVSEPRWKVLDTAVGTISKTGRFTASESLGIYSKVVEVSFRVPTSGGEAIFSKTASIAIIEVPVFTTEPGVLSQAAIFPERVVLASGQSARISVVLLDDRGISPQDVSMRWSLKENVANTTQFGNVTAGDTPGTYPDVIQVEISQETEEGVITRKLTATLVIMGPLVRVDAIPGVAQLGPGGRVQFRAIGFDENGQPLPDVNFRWRVANKDAGSISHDGVFTASKSPGHYPGAVTVQAIQHMTK